MNYIHQDYLPRVGSALGSWFSKAAYALRRKASKPPTSKKWLAAGQTTILPYSPEQSTDHNDQRGETTPDAVKSAYRNSVLNRYVHTQYKLASYRRMYTRPSSTVPGVPYS